MRKHKNAPRQKRIRTPITAPTAPPITAPRSFEGAGGGVEVLAEIELVIAGTDVCDPGVDAREKVSVIVIGAAALAPMPLVASEGENYDIPL